MPNNQTKGLAHGAMMIAIFAVLIAISLYVPLVSFVATIFAPLPLAWYSSKYDRNQSIFVAIFAIAITFFIGGLLILPFSFIFASIGVVMGMTLQLKKSKIFLLMATGLTVLITFAIDYLITLKLFEVDFIKETMQLMRTSYEQSLTLTQNITGQSPLTTEDLELLFVTLETTIPAAVTIAAFVLAFIIISLNLPILKRLGINVPKFSALKDLKLPRSILWYYLIVLSINLFVKPEVGTTLYVICLNLSMVLWVLLTIQGLSFILYFLDKKVKLTNLIKVLVILLAIPLYSFVVLIGIVDLGFDIRGLVKDKVQK
ncbi:YybS family protein [Ureibacillus sp. MALMAid1270]|uniref:YybS family protein n=1 Tax=Ureibacillus sp. MALMAid1270 TaxID=3411629 RepID=UPI003BA66CF8